MAVKNIFGIIILILNAAGLGFMAFMGFQALINHFFPKETPIPEPGEGVPQKAPVMMSDDIIPDEDDLLKDMDLSDLDNLNLDDFE